MKEFFKIRLYRTNCVKVKNESGTIYIKDLRIIKNVPLKNMIIIDNSVLSFAFHLENGIPVLPFYNNKNDNELLHLKDYLMELCNSEDIQASNSKVFNLKKLMHNAEEEIHITDKELEKINKIESIQDLNENVANKLSLEFKLNLPVRKDSNFQKKITETLLHARQNVLSINSNNEFLKKTTSKFYSHINNEVKINEENDHDENSSKSKD